jgi:hypothetical protein
MTADVGRAVAMVKEFWAHSEGWSTVSHPGMTLVTKNLALPVSQNRSGVDVMGTKHYQNCNIFALRLPMDATRTLSSHAGHKGFFCKNTSS